MQAIVGSFTPTSGVIASFEKGQNILPAHKKNVHFSNRLEFILC